MKDGVVLQATYFDHKGRKRKGFADNPLKGYIENKKLSKSN